MVRAGDTVATLTRQQPAPISRATRLGYAQLEASLREALAGARRQEIGRARSRFLS